MVGVHSHGDLYEIRRNIIKRYRDVKLLMLSIPCCKGMHKKFMESSDFVTDDLMIPSTKNTIYAWKYNWTDET